jgi:glycine/D-amino acid oxidase-like deaminating enzyme
MKQNGIIVGAGIIGSAIAYELARRGMTDLHVLDVDLEGGLSSTERNAGGVRHLWMNRVNMDLARCSIALFSELADTIGFQKKGYLWLFSEEERGSGEATLERALKNNLDYEQLSTSEIRKRYPFIDKTDDLAFALFGPRDGLINSNALKQYFREEAKKRGAIFHDRVWVEEISESPGSAQVKGTRVPSLEAAEELLNRPAQAVKAEKVTWNADFVVLAGGAWMNHLLQSLVKDPMVEPVRRQISFFKSDTLDLSPYGMVVDTSRVYFHAEGGNILSGFVLKDEKPGYRFDKDPGFFESHIWPALHERSSHFERLKEVSGWGGLYSYTPDTSGLLGWLPEHKRVLEAHSFTGRGVMQSYGAAVAIADLVLEGRFIHIDAQGLTRERFNEPKATWLFEGLHI